MCLRENFIKTWKTIKNHCFIAFLNVSPRGDNNRHNPIFYTTWNDVARNARKNIIPETTSHEKIVYSSLRKHGKHITLNICFSYSQRFPHIDRKVWKVSNIRECNLCMSSTVFSYWEKTALKHIYPLKISQSNDLCSFEYTSIDLRTKR